VVEDLESMALPGDAMAGPLCRLFRQFTALGWSRPVCLTRARVEEGTIITDLSVVQAKGERTGRVRSRSNTIILVPSIPLTHSADEERSDNRGRHDDCETVAGEGHVPDPPQEEEVMEEAQGRGGSGRSHVQGDERRDDVRLVGIGQPSDDPQHRAEIRHLDRDNSGAQNEHRADDVPRPLR
jgi:hypothetical protein